jgi:hypothetical protein
MKVELFSTPVFIDKVDLSRIELTETKYEPTFFSDVKSNYLFQPQLHPDSYDYLSQIIERNLKETGQYINPTITAIWRNVYEPQNMQEVHIHADAQWSFIIYETVEHSRTVFLNPAWKQIEVTMGYFAPSFPPNWRPKLEAGSILIFPSYIEHYVLAGNAGSTIAGNVNLQYTQKDNQPLKK